MITLAPNHGFAVIVDHYEGGQHEIYDTDDPGAQGCESTTLICNLPPSSSRIGNASSNNGTMPTCLDNNWDGQCDIKWEAPPPGIAYSGIPHRCLDGNQDGQCDIQMEPPPQTLTQQPQVDWTGICSSLQPALLSPCTSLVSSNGTLTYEGERAVGCIRNGALLAAGAGLNAIPLNWIIGGLQALEGPTGCSGIVNWEMLNQVGGTDSILDLIPAGP